MRLFCLLVLSSNFFWCQGIREAPPVPSFGPISTEPAISKEEYNTLIEKILAYLNKMHDRHPNVTKSLAVDIGKAAANFSMSDEERRAALDSLILKLNGTSMNEAEMKAERLVNYFNNYKIVLEKLKLDGGELWGQLSKLSFKENWDEMNFRERKQLILRVLQEVATNNYDSHKEIIKISPYWETELKWIQVADRDALVQKLLTPLNRAVNITDASNKTLEEYFQRVWRTAADYEQEATSRQERLEKMFTQDYKKAPEAATKFAKAFINLADSVKELLEKMGMYAVDVFQKSYKLVFNKEFRSADEEKKKQMIWDAIKVSMLNTRGLSMSTQGSSSVVYTENGQTIMETTTLDIHDGIVFKNETIRTVTGNATDYEN